MSSEARFCLMILSFCVKMMRANDCFKIVQTLKEDKLTPSFLPYEPKYILPDLGVAAKSMQILYVVLSDLHHDGDEFSCAVSADGNVNALFYYGSDAWGIFPAITRAVKERACCWKWMILIAKQVEKSYQI